MDPNQAPKDARAALARLLADEATELSKGSFLPDAWRKAE